jgi:hypothetical protein
MVSKIFIHFSQSKWNIFNQQSSKISQIHRAASIPVDLARREKSGGIIFSCFIFICVIKYFDYIPYRLAE